MTWKKCKCNPSEKIFLKWKRDLLFAESRLFLEEERITLFLRRKKNRVVFEKKEKKESRLFWGEEKEIAPFLRRRKENQVIFEKKKVSRRFWEERKKNHVIFQKKKKNCVFFEKKKKECWRALQNICSPTMEPKVLYKNHITCFLRKKKKNHVFFGKNKKESRLFRGKEKRNFGNVDALQNICADNGTESVV